MRFFLLATYFSLIFGEPSITLSRASDQIPRVGKGIEFLAVVANQEELQAPRLYITRDSLPFELTMKLQMRDTDNRLVYSALVPSPQFELKAIAYLSRSGGKIVKSNLLTISRACRPKVALTPDEELRNANHLNVALLNQLILEDLELYQNLIRQVEQLNLILKE